MQLPPSFSLRQRSLRRLRRFCASSFPSTGRKFNHFVVAECKHHQQEQIYDVLHRTLFEAPPLGTGPKGSLPLSHRILEMADGTTPTKCKRIQRLIAMKGHPGSGKSTLARALARELGCALIDKDDIRDCTTSLEEGSTHPGPKLPSSMLNTLSYEVMWQVASTQLAAGLTVVVDCPLARPALFTRAQATADRHGAELVVVECRCSDVEQWKTRLQGRAMAAAKVGQQQQSWHKPAKWEEMEKILDGYAGCWDYGTGSTPKLVLDTTAVTAADAQASALLWLHKLDKVEDA